MLTSLRQSKWAVSAIGLALAGAATLVYVEFSVGSGDDAPAPRRPASDAAPAPAARQEPVKLAKPAAPAVEAAPAVSAPAVVPAAPPVPASGPVRAVTTVRAVREPAVRAPATPAGMLRYEITGRLSQADAAVFRGNFPLAEDRLAELKKPGVLLQDDERGWLERIEARMDRAKKLLGDAPAAGNVLAAADAKPEEKPAADKPADAKPADAKPADPAAAPGAPAPAPAAAPAGEAPAAQPGLLDQAAEFDKIIREMTLAEFEKRMQSAEELLAKGNYELADQAASTAIQVVQSNALYLPNRGADLVARAEALRTRIRQAKVDTENKLKAERELENKIKDINEKNRLQEEKNTRIRTFLRNAEDALREGDPARALEMYDLVLKIDPGNVAANARKSVVSDMYDHLVMRGIDLTVKRQETFNNIDLLEGRIPWYHEIRLPADWDELSRRRLERLSEDEDPTAIRERERLDRNARKLLNTIKPTLNLPGIPLNQAIEFIRDIWGANIVVNYEALAGAGVDTEKLINLPNLKDISLRGALELVFDQISAAGGDANTKPGFIVDTGVIIVSTAEQLNAKTATVVYDISDLVLVERIPTDPQQVQLSQFSQGSGVFTQGTQGGGTGGANNLFGGGQGGQQDFTAAQEEDARRKLIDDILNLVKTVDPATFGTDPAADAPGQMKEFQGSLVVRQTRANHDKIRKLLSDLRSISQKQVSIDVRFVQIDAAVLEQILFDIDIDFTNLLFGALQRGRGSFLSYTTNGISASGFGTGVGNPPLAVRGSVPAPAGSPPGTPPADNPMFGQSGPHPLDLLAFNPSTGESKDFGQSNAKILGNQTGMLLNGAIIDDVAVRFFLQATQASNRTALFTSPKVTVLNGRKATIAVRSFQPYVSNVKSNVGGGAGAVGVDPQIQLAENGTTMWVRAVVSHDNRFVTMQLNPILTITNLDQIQAFNVTGGGNAVDGNNGNNGNIIQTPGVNIQQPRRFEQNIFTTVKVPDKGTVVLGGFKTSNEVERELGVPILDKIPVIKRLFANRSYGRDDSVLIILVKPTVHLYEEIDPFHDLRPGAR